MSESLLLLLLRLAQDLIEDPDRIRLLENLMEDFEWRCPPRRDEEGDQTTHALYERLRSQLVADLAVRLSDFAALEADRDAWRAATGLADGTPEEAGDKIDADDAERHKLMAEIERLRERLKLADAVMVAARKVDETAYNTVVRMVAEKNMRAALVNYDEAKEGDHE
jgi:hypothetical protein